MLDRDALRHAVTMQQQSYLLLKWLSKSVQEGFIQFQTAHRYSTLPAASAEWIVVHYHNIPPSARPSLEDIEYFSQLFSTYLENSFDLLTQPGVLRYSPDAHCFCPVCSWLIQAPHLKAKKLTARDKRSALRMMERALQQTAIDSGIAVDATVLNAILANSDNHESLAYIAYGYDLLERVQGIANGPAVLALWRMFAWNRQGSPKRNFKLQADAILAWEGIWQSNLRENKIGVVPSFDPARTQL